MKRVLLIGGSGQLGTAIRGRWNDCEIVAPPHAELPIERNDLLQAALRRFRPEVLINAAAFHDVDRCEAEPLTAFEINAVAVGTAARAVHDAGAVFVTLSTDYVFDGAAEAPYAEHDAARPLSVYGVSKLAGELLAGERARAFVVRTCGVYGQAARPGRPSLIERVLEHRPEDGPLRVVADVHASPTFAGDLAAALRRLVETDAYGLYHAADAGPVSWYEFAREAATQAGVVTALEPIPASDWKAAARRPRFSALASGKLAALGIAMPPWRDGIAAYLAGRIR